MGGRTVIGLLTYLGAVVALLVVLPLAALVLAVIDALMNMLLAALPTWGQVVLFGAMVATLALAITAKVLA